LLKYFFFTKYFQDILNLNITNVMDGELIQIINIFNVGFIAIQGTVYIQFPNSNIFTMYNWLLKNNYFYASVIIWPQFRNHQLFYSGIFSSLINLSWMNRAPQITVRNIKYDSPFSNLKYYNNASQCFILSL
jgi:hypothetical protein